MTIATNTGTTAQIEKVPTIELKDGTIFAFDYVSIGLIVGVVVWGFNVWRSHDKRLIDVETRMKLSESNQQETLSEMKVLEEKMTGVSDLRAELKEIKREITYLTESVRKDFEIRNGTITESKQRIQSLEIAMTKMSENITILVNRLAGDVPSLFGRRSHDRDDPPSNPARYP